MQGKGMVFMKFTIYMLRTVSVISLLYFFLILWASGLRTSFLGFWLALSISCMGTSFLLKFLIASSSPFSLTTSRVIIGLIWLSLSIFILMEGFIISESLKAPRTQANYVIVLGAQVRGFAPSRTLNARILTAAEYLLENPDSKVICSGGQGEGELITEAQAMKEGLLAKGISETRILTEEASTNTVQNLIYSKEMIADPSAQVVIVTSDFHIYRAKKLAEHLGYQNLSMCPANEFMITSTSYYVREVFALLKDWFVGNL